MLNFKRGAKLFKLKDLRKRVITVAVILVAFRILANIPIPGVDSEALISFFSSNQLLGFLNIFSGGALSNLSIAMLGLGPYITAIIIMQLLTMIFPKLKSLYYEEGEQGRSKFNRYSRYLTVPLAGMQGYGFLRILASQGILPNLTLASTLVNVLIIVAGSMILVWFGELITEQKMGNGVSLLIFAGIVSGIPLSMRNALLSYTTSQLPTFLAFITVALLVIVGIVLVHEGERKVPISYAKRVRGNKMYGGVSSYLPFRVGQAGVIPIIFAISLLLFPQFFGQIIAGFSPGIGATINDFTTGLLNNQVVYGLIYFTLVFLFTYFYIGITFDPDEISKNLQRSGGFVPGIRPGQPTADFLKSIVSKITFFGGLFLGFIAVLPTITQSVTGTQALTLGGTSILIVVAVVIETAKQIDAELTVREYEGV
ncbi:MAG: Protein translocase subunit SecY [Parcubacteria group bacterium GW2011_GWB1_45_7]|uniref:Protein translocase subunit SecY n=4 Tax=Parcubacteria group TaxID=1794811 RepID=A0A0H4TC56_9BACT|nr:preprotein translocase subunit SecY, preprotein translocase subunit SecY [uncultured Parcubacteria bacterium Rifle_16ft_4_minimus_37647]AKQ05598.1 preprotein translocase subunit SecY, preprotein translocase subunit SecY [uncultured Parcubacteria bacterium Rifle_16ft_4_minimus_23790]KKU11930.1 MAG: Protein translocase subunit SecY [Parcubacteria group bacterium GW2011_GWB1_45_7]OGY58613.1 MAG: preprotein translocase subunit SecY [Candidatus Colwellbacteria bacterium RIFCSPHIGHO2_02_FULL_45_17]